jgi:hypothetical protein
MSQLSDQEFHSEIRAALMALDPAVLRGLAGSEVRRKVALDQAADAFWAHFACYVIYDPGRSKNE